VIGLFAGKVYSWMPSCRKCNNWVEENDAEARKMGLKKSKFSK
jgi:hypothetical protein